MVKTPIPALGLTGVAPAPAASADAGADAGTAGAGAASGKCGCNVPGTPAKSGLLSLFGLTVALGALRRRLAHRARVQ
jgi:MYXO-CTERM domain-containing protein